MSKKRFLFLSVTVVVLVLGYLFVWPVAQLGMGLVRKGILDKAENRTYNGDVPANLKALHTAMMFVHESDGQFPPADKWMDAAKVRIQTGDMTPEEARKKLLDPTLGGKEGAFGFAMNDACSGKYKGDLKDPKTILLYQSKDVKWNAHGDPKKDAPNPPRGGKNYGITVSGDIVPL